MMAKNHPIVAAPWQLGRSLELILLPLVPEPRDCARYWVWGCEPLDLFWFKSEGVGDRLLKKLPWQVGDRIYFQEEWIVSSRKEAPEPKSSFPSEAQTDDWINWQPAHTMPEAAATQWYAIEEVRVCQGKDITIEQLEKSGFIDISDDSTFATNIVRAGQRKERWNAAHPDYPWHGDRYVVALQVKSATFEISKQK